MTILAGEPDVARGSSLKTCLALFTIKVSTGPLKNFSKFALVVWPAIANICLNIYIYMSEQLYYIDWMTIYRFYPIRSIEVTVKY